MISSNKRILLSLLSFLLLSNIASSDVVNLPTEVDSAATGGYWENGKLAGSYRVIVVNRGWEHIMSRVYLQWIETDQKNMTRKVIATIPVKEFEQNSFIAGLPHLKLEKKNWLFSIDITDSYTHEEKKAYIIPSSKPPRYTWKLVDNK